MNARIHPSPRHLGLCEPENSPAFDGLPADPDAAEYRDSGSNSAVSMARPDRWLWIPAG
ncbi:hypothetical protein [Williamsia soli]|uniref:hypothetical protein n=1 Tax=Williamsia soli TaxID=364929 RepID=UPI001A9D1859|nr:hypothetical protein [Williamsia soli]